LVGARRRNSGHALTVPTLQQTEPLNAGDESLTAGDEPPSQLITRIAPVEPELSRPAIHQARVPLLPGQQTLERKIKFGLVNCCTIASIVLGMLAILLAIQGEVREAALALMGCVIFDGVDGGLARRLGVSSPFGVQMDSLADMCSFGLATPVVVFQWLQADTPVAALGPLCVMVAVCAAIRLARFNVSPKDGRYFSGVPTTIAAAILALAALLSPEPIQPLLLLVIVGGLALLMVSSFPYAKLAQIRRLPPWLWLLPVAGMLIDVLITFVVLVGIYLISGPLLWLRHRHSTPA